MSCVQVKTQRPVQFDVKSAVRCDACGTEAPPRNEVFPVPPRGWFSGYVAPSDSGAYEVDQVTDRVDYCPVCWPKIHAAAHQEEKTITAEKVAAAAEVSGVSA